MMNRSQHMILDVIDYDQVDFRRWPPAQYGPLPQHQPKIEPLVESSARILSLQHFTLIELAITEFLPTHLATTLLHHAIVQKNEKAITTIVANWPLTKLRFMEVIPYEPQTFQIQMQVDLYVFRGVIQRTKKCRMTSIDFRGFTLNDTFQMLIVQIWPLLSVKRRNRNSTKLTNIIVNKSGLKNCIDPKIKDIHTRLESHLQNNEMMRHPVFNIHIPKDKMLSVYLDRLEFQEMTPFYLDYLSSSWIRSVAPLHVHVSNIILRANTEEDMYESSMNMDQFLVFYADHNITGLCLERYMDDVFTPLQPIIHRFHSLKRLALVNCHIRLKAGRTRQCTQSRIPLMQFLKACPLLTHLDLSENTVSQCLHEVLDSVNLPLQFLSLRQCDMLDMDLQALATSKHSASLRELNLNRVCGLFADDGFAAHTTRLLELLTDSAYFQSLTALHIMQNQVRDEHIDAIAPRIAAGCWQKLKCLNISNNILSADSVLTLVKACCTNKSLSCPSACMSGTPSLQYIHVPYMHALLDMLDAAENARQNFTLKIQDVLKASGRQDIYVYVSTRTYLQLF